MVFFQAAAPTSWTQVTTQNNKALRVVSGAGGGAAGTVAFSALGATETAIETASHTHTGPSHGHVQNVGLTNLDSASTVVGVGASSGANATMSTYSASGGDITRMNSGVGGGGTGPTGNQSANHAHVSIQPQYIDVIICSKN
jgi:hypothetical protein